MPCCHKDESSIQYCFACVAYIARTYGNDNVTGQCPTCYELYHVEGDSVSKPPERQETCTMCCQTRVIEDRSRQLCRMCKLGSQFVFKYECNRCHRKQRIPHPMFTYQPSANEFTSASWYCHQGCRDQTYWRITPESVPGLPLQHVPQCWGQREEWLAAVREGRRGEDPRGAERNDSNNTRGSCAIS